MSISKMTENKDYELVPAPDDSTVWHIRILTGDYTETIIKFDKIAFNEVKDHFTFNFTIVESPDQYLSIDDTNLHDVSARILEDVIERGHKEGWVKLEDKKEPFQ